MELSTTSHSLLQWMGFWKDCKMQLKATIKLLFPISRINFDIRLQEMSIFYHRLISWLINESVDQSNVIKQWQISSHRVRNLGLHRSKLSTAQTYSVYYQIRRENSIWGVGTREYLQFVLKKLFKWLINYQNSCLINQLFQLVFYIQEIYHFGIGKGTQVLAKTVNETHPYIEELL